MIDERKVYRVTVSCEAEIFVLAKDASEARSMGRDNARDLLDPWDADIDAREEKAKLGITLYNDDRTVAEFMGGEPSAKEKEAAAKAAWLAQRPSGTPVEWAAWLASSPDGVGCGGELVWGGWAAMRASGASLGEVKFRSTGPATAAKAIETIRTGARNVVTRGEVVEVLGVYGHVMTCRMCGPAYVQTSLMDQWLPGEPTEIRASSALEGVYFCGPGWETVIMPVQTKEARR